MKKPETPLITYICYFIALLMFTGAAAVTMILLVGESIIKIPTPIGIAYVATLLFYALVVGGVGQLAEYLGQSAHYARENHQLMISYFEEAKTRDEAKIYYLSQIPPNANQQSA